jgi:hypothetical protein
MRSTCPTSTCSRVPVSSNLETEGPDGKGVNIHPINSQYLAVFLKTLNIHTKIGFYEKKKKKMEMCRCKWTGCHKILTKFENLVFCEDFVEI